MRIPELLRFGEEEVLLKFQAKRTLTIFASVIVGTVCLAVFLKDDHIHGSPFVVSVHKGIKYEEGAKKYILGLDADGPGQFTCPYGVAISPLTGDIWVTDSGNEQDQIQVGVVVDDGDDDGCGDEFMYGNRF